MFEFQVGHQHLAAADLPDRVKVLFKDFDAEITAVALIPWEEHCTECAVPQCFTSCDLYSPRSDGKCRRFVGGISPVPGAPNLQNYVVGVSFKRWGELMAEANVQMVGARTAARVERLGRRVEETVSRIPDHGISIRGRRGISSRLYRRFKKRLTSGGLLSGNGHTPDYFLAEIYNPNAFDVSLSLVMRSLDRDRAPIPFQKRLELSPGFHRFKFDHAEIARVVGDSRQLHIMLNPNLLEPSQEGLRLYFGMLTFVSDRKYAVAKTPAAEASSAKRVKVVAWDLDNTVWDGILLEVGADGIRLKPGIVDIIRELDRRGIMNSVVSKNHPKETEELLERFGLQDYLLFSKIGWDPKGACMKRLIEDFNVGANTVVFIDDSPFERAQVESMNPQVRVIDAAEYDTILSRPEFSPPITKEASRRREFYRNQEVRKGALDTFEGDYVEFLRDCEVNLFVEPASDAQLGRVHELVQRTNQLNFSGNRYSRDELAEMFANPALELYVMTCTDRFGEYGIIGFAVVESAAARLVDLMFSCRIQAKRIEHGFLSFLLNTYKSRGAERFEASYRKTDRNAKAGQVFEDLGFRETSLVDAVLGYEFDLKATVPDDRIVRLFWQGQRCSF